MKTGRCHNQKKRQLFRLSVTRKVAVLNHYRKGKDTVKINLSLKMKLTISYVLFAILLVISLLVASNYFLEQKFQSYVIEKQERKNQDIVNLVRDQFGEDGEAPDGKILENIGNTAVSQGIILMVNDPEGKELFCMSTLNGQMCDSMIESMRTYMTSIYPHFKGEYVQKEYDIVRDGVKLGTATLGYYGPFYYNDEDVQCMEVLNRIFNGVAVISLAAAAARGFFMADRIAKPSRKVIDQTRQIESGDYADRLTLTSRTKEISRLIGSVNALADTLERQQASKRRMARDYAHEFRTPLAALQANLEAMIDGIWEPTEERLESCREEILRLTRMIAEIDRLVKIEDDSLVLHKTEFDLAGLAGQTAQNFKANLAAKNIRLETSLDSFELHADKDKITQVLINLLSNAVKYTDDGGQIRIRVRKSKNRAELIVSDTGIGIAAEDLPNIFEHLYRTDKSRNRSTGGSGIGLSIVKAIVEAHGGAITAKSELGKGSEFMVSLPL